MQTIYCLQQNIILFGFLLKAYLGFFSKNFFLGLSRNSIMPPEVGQANKEMVLRYLFCHGWLIETVKKL